MTTKEEVVAAPWSQVWHYTGNHECSVVVGPRGGVRENIVRCRTNGNVQTWVRRPDKFRLPIKHGMREYGAITDVNKEVFHREEDCPALIGQRESELARKAAESAALAELLGKSATLHDAMLAVTSETVTWREINVRQAGFNVVVDNEAKETNNGDS